MHSNRPRRGMQRASILTGRFTMSNAHGNVILFTAFEPSGDAHAAPVIAALKQLAPDVRIFAWGGPKMEAAGAEMMGSTCDDGAMGLGGFAEIHHVHKTIREIRRWAKGVPLVGYVPVDSPAANFPICKVMRKRGVRVMHLVAPQLWAWGPWRIKKLRRLTDMVLCLLPFEEAWFKERSVPATFIGHPVIARELDSTKLAQDAADYPHGAPKILILPGSRSGEIKANLGTLVRAFGELRNRNGRTEGVIVAANERIANLIRKKLQPMPSGLHLSEGDLDTAIHWADLALTVSGTVSLDLLRHDTPMVGMYNVGFVSWLLSKILLRAPYRLLPNVVANEGIVPEFVPHLKWRGSGPIRDAATELLSDTRHLAQARAALAHVRAEFAGHDPAKEAAEAILEVLGKRTPRERDVEIEAPTTKTESVPPPPRRAVGFSPGAQTLGLDEEDN